MNVFFHAHVEDAGQMGVELITPSKPRECPGLGGWKRLPDGQWMTRIKGEEACEKILTRLEGIRQNGFTDDVLAFEMDGGRLI